MSFLLNTQWSQLKYLREQHSSSECRTYTSGLMKMFDAEQSRYECSCVADVLLAAVDITSLVLYPALRSVEFWGNEIGSGWIGESPVSK